MIVSAGSYVSSYTKPSIYRYVEGEQRKPSFTPADMKWVKDGIYEIFSYAFPVGNKNFGKTYDFGLVFWCKKHKSWEAALLVNIITPLGLFKTKEEAKASVLSAAWYFYWRTVEAMNAPKPQEG